METVKDRALSVSTTTGTGDYTLSGSVTGYQTIAAALTAGKTFYGTVVAVDGSGVPTGAWETGLYTYSATNTVKRTRIDSSSNSGAAVSWGAGNKQISISLTARQFVDVLEPTKETATLEGAIRASGGTMSPMETRAHDRFVTSAKRAGYWDKLIDVGTFSGGTLASAMIKLKFPASGVMTPTAFVDADVTVSGVVGNGTTKWINTNTSFSELPNTGDSGMAVFLTKELGGGYAQLMGLNAGGTPQYALRWTGESVHTLEAIMNGSGATTGYTNKRRAKMAVGLHHAERTGDVINMYCGGLISSTAASTFTYSSSNNPIALFSEVGGSWAAAATIGMFVLTDGSMTPTDAQSLSDHCNALMSALGRVAIQERPANLVPIIGQSLAVGAQGAPALTTTQPYLNLAAESLAAGNPADTRPTFWKGDGDSYQIGALTPMVEMGVETIATPGANFVSAASRAGSGGATNDVTSINLGLGATDYAGMKRGTAVYANCVASAKVALGAAALYASGPPRVPAVWCVHGESDADSNTYQTDIREWQANYEADFRAITGQAEGVPMFHSQHSSWTSSANINSDRAKAPYAILAEHEANPTKSVLVCPKYPFVHDAGDGVHLTNVGYQKLGELYGKAHYQHVVMGVQWEPLRPISITRSGAQIDVVFTGNVGNLVFDTAAVTDPSGASNTKGFEYKDNTKADSARYTSISSVALLNANTVRVTLAADPGAAAGKLLSYAYTGTAGNNGGPTTGARGCLRDSDTTVGPTSGATLSNWCVHFRKTLT